MAKDGLTRRTALTQAVFGSSFLPGRIVLAAIAAIAAIAEMVVCVACSGGATGFLDERDREIDAATRTIATSQAASARAQAHSARGSAYSEKARYGKLQKLISEEEYEHLFELAIKDHDQAVALGPTDADLYFNRGQSYYDRGSIGLIYDGDPYAATPRNDPWLRAAVTDFEKAAELDPRRALIYDRLGLAYEANRDDDAAIQAYLKEVPLDRRLGSSRLANLYCIIGYRQQLQSRNEGAVAAYRQSLEYGTPDDKSCPVDPSDAIGRLASMGHDR